MTLQDTVLACVGKLQDGAVHSVPLSTIPLRYVRNKLASDTTLKCRCTWASYWWYDTSGSETIGHTVGVDSIVVKRRGDTGDGFNTFDSLIKCAILANIFNNDELKPIITVCEFILEEGALGL